MFSVAWGVFATAFGWIVATDFRGAAHRFHELSHAVTPFGGGGAPVVGVGFFRMVAGMFALVGPFVLVGGLLEVWRGEAGPGGLPPLPAWAVVGQALAAGVFLWTMWRRSGLLRRVWDTGTGPRRAAAAVLTASVVAFVAALGLGWKAWTVASWLVGGLCGLTLILGGRLGPAVAGPSGES